MKEKKLTQDQKKASIDLFIIVGITFVILSTYMGIQPFIVDFVKNNQLPVFVRTIVMAFMQFGVAGLGITVVSVIRKERFIRHGLNTRNLLKTILLSSVVVIPSFLFYYFTDQVSHYLPFQTVWMTNVVLSSAFPVNVIGYVMIAVAWGFFEGFNYVFISDKLNVRFPTKYKWLDVGAIVSGFMCLFIHGMIGITPEGMLEAVTTFIIIYGMLMTRKFTGNSWGCIVIFIFYWNAI